MEVPAYMHAKELQTKLIGEMKTKRSGGVKWEGEKKVGLIKGLEVKEIAEVCAHSSSVPFYAFEDAKKLSKRLMVQGSLCFQSTAILTVEDYEGFAPRNNPQSQGAKPQADLNVQQQKKL